jgi:hypothetical protein
MTIRIHSPVSAPDADRLDFIQRLDSCVAIEVTDWEAQFIENLLTNPRPLTPAQRVSIDSLRNQYEGQL